MTREPMIDGVRCRAQRMLNPYRGVMHSVLTQWADAVTTDGRNWTLYVSGECLYDDLADTHNPNLTVPDVKYGTWSEATGFHRAPIRLPTFEARVRHEGDGLLRAVRRHAPELPFALTDRYEHWLLDAATGLPFALIGSACDPRECETPALLRWTPGQACMAELPQARTLFALVAEAAGPKPRARWFNRQPDGSGAPCANCPSGSTDDDEIGLLRAGQFGRLQLTEARLEQDQLTLLDVVYQWQAPALLQLPNLSPERRAYFEIAACCHAVRLAEQLPLYPCVLDEAAITAALIEARLRNSHPATTGDSATADPISPYYLETPGD